MCRHQLATFAGEIAHELRTPLSVIAGDVDLALARDRSPAAYREVLTHIAERVAELIDLTKDVAVLGDAGEVSESSTATASLDAVFEALSDRYGERRGTPVTLEAARYRQKLASDETLITSALSLLLEHALRHRRDGSRVRLRALTTKDVTMVSGTADLLLDAPPAGFSNSTWHGLAGGFDTSQPAHGRLRLRLETAARIIHGCGGVLELTSAGGAECVLIRLRLASALSEAVDGIR